MKTRTGFSLLEVVSVLVLLSLIVGISLFGLQDTQERQIRQKVHLDLSRIDSAKASWRIDHPRAEFPANEPDRFTQLQPYLKSGLQSINSLSELEPSAQIGYVIHYSIEAEDTKAKAHNTTLGLVFNRETQDWESQ